MLQRTGGDVRDRRSIPERIADAIDYDIAALDHGIGERLVETQLARRHKASRGSVREALRILAQRGSVQIIAGRGAIVRGYSLARLADAFAAAGMLIALGARYVARQRSPQVMDRIGERLERLRDLSEQGFARPYDFATALGGVTAAIVVGSDNHYVRSQVSAILNRSVWQAMWEHPCDHLTVERQREEVATMEALVERLQAGDAEAAERLVREFHQRHCDSVLQELARQRGERAPPSPPLSLAEPAPATSLEARVARIEEKVERMSRASGKKART